MKKLPFVILLLLATFKLVSQEVMFKHEIKLKSGITKKRESLPVINDDKNEIMLFLLDKKNINTFRFNLNYELLDNTIIKRPKTKFNILLGHSTNLNGYSLFFTNDNKNQFYIQSIGYNNKTESGKQLQLKLKEEKFLETISYNNKFYLITIKKRSSFLKIYSFNGNSITNVANLDFGSEKFSNSKYSKLFDVLLDKNNAPFQLDLDVSKVDNTNPNPLDITTKAHKLYYYDDKIFLTLDKDKDYTRLITINLKDFSSKIDLFAQPALDCKNKVDTKSNSYLLHNKLYQVKGCKNGLSLHIINTKNDSILKQHEFNTEEEISFKNTQLIQEGSVFHGQNTKRELEKTKQILRKMLASDIGVTARLTDENLELTIGGYKKITGGGGGGGFMMSNSSISTSQGSLNFTTYHYNPTMFGYWNYSNTRSVYFKTLLDKATLRHNKGKVLENAFDKIKKFEDNVSYKIVSETIFKVNDFYMFGYYSKKDNKYYLRKFEN